MQEQACSFQSQGLIIFLWPKIISEIQCMSNLSYIETGFGESIFAGMAFILYFS